MFCTTFESNRQANRWRLLLDELRFALAGFVLLSIYSWLSENYFPQFRLSFKQILAFLGGYLLHVGIRWLFPGNETYVSSVVVDEPNQCLIVRYYRSWEGETEKRLPFASTRIEIIRYYLGNKPRLIRLLPAKMDAIEIKSGRFELDRTSINELAALLEAITHKSV